MTTRRRVAFVLSNQAVSSVTGWPIGFWLAELTHPYAEFERAGFEIDLFSPQGGALYMDDFSDLRSGNLITGQQQHSGAEAARLAIEVLA